MTPISRSFFLWVVAHRTLSKTASTATPASRFRSSSGMPSFSKVFEDFRIDFIHPVKVGFCLGLAK